MLAFSQENPYNKTQKKREKKHLTAIRCLVSNNTVVKRSANLSTSEIVHHYEINDYCEAIHQAYSNKILAISQDVKQL